MSELKLPRLLAAAKEFNVGQDTLVDFLTKKGFSREELTPMAKLTEPMYIALQQEFQGDKNAKSKADAVEIPKSHVEHKKRRDEEEITFKREDKKQNNTPQPESSTPVTPVQIAPVVEQLKPTPKIEVEKETIIPTKDQKTEIHRIEVPKVEIKKVEIPKIDLTKVESPKIDQIVTSKVEDKKTVDENELEKNSSLEQEKSNVSETEKSNTSAPQEVETLKISVPEIEGPKIIDKIDLSSIDFSTRPKKGVPQKKETTTETSSQQPEINKVVIPTVPTVEVTETILPETIPQIELPKSDEPAQIVSETEEKSSLIENIEVEKITGPKIIGKIQLPIDSDTRPKAGVRDESRVRKRIPLNNTGSQPQQGNYPAQQNNNQGQNRFNNNNQGNRPPGQFQQRPPQQGGFVNRGPGQNNNSQGNNRFNQPNQQPQNRSNTPNNFQRPNNPNAPARGRDVRPEAKEIDAKEIQDKIKETQARLAGSSGRGKSLKAKYRRAKREEAAESSGDIQDDNKLQVTEFVTVSELANLMDVSFTDIIGKCMGLGIMVSINQRLDAEVIELVVGEFGYEVEFIGVDDILEDVDDETDAPENQSERPPIVTIMGHVDHGKTSLLDYIRNANVVAGEAGGITQHIGAYEVTLANGKSITFLDTPGHEAFTAMRARGAKVTDIAVIVVAADDAVMPQTKEAISHAQAAGVPMIFAVNKIDKDGAQPQKIYEQLSQMNILVEEWGGKFQSQELSAKKGLNVDILLEKILLESELLDVKANPDKDASGTIIEASLDKGRGYVATILVQNGTLKQGDIVVSGQYFGKIKAMFNERNQRVKVAPPSTPVVILGINGAPQAGEKFKVYTDEAEAKEVASKRGQILREQGLRARKHITLDEIGRRLALGNFKELNIIIKGDVDGSVEALSDSLQKLSTGEVAVKVVHKAVGQISESDVLLATASDAILIGFNVRPSAQANKLAMNEGVEIKMYSIIYNAIEEVKSAMEGMLEPKIQEKEVANIEIREVFKFDKATVAGCFVLDGRFKRDAKVRLFRDGILVYPRQEGGFAELGSLKRYKDDVKEVLSGMECGLTIKNYTDINVGDTIVAYEEEEIKRSL